MNWTRVTVSAMAVIVSAIMIYVGTLMFYNPTTVVIIVRHAERPAGEDPPLTLEGEERAQTLAHVADRADVGAIFATQFRRTQQTVQPLAAQEGIAVISINKDDLDGLVAQINAPRGFAVLVAGHTDTIPELIQRLGGGNVGMIGETDFDNLFVVHIPRWGTPHVVILQYGRPTT